MSKHPIPQWLREQFSNIEDEVQKLGPCGVFTQMRTVTQTYFEQAAAPQPPALGGEPGVVAFMSPHGGVFEAYLSPEQAFAKAKQVGGEPIALGRIDEFQSTLAPLQAENSQLRQHKIDYMEAAEETRKALQAEIDRLNNLHDVDTEMMRLLSAEDDQLTARCDELESALKFYADREHYHFESGNWDTVSGEPLNILWCGDEPDFIEDGTVARAALFKSAGSDTTLTDFGPEHNWTCETCKTEQPTDRACDVCNGSTKPAGSEQ